MKDSFASAGREPSRLFISDTHLLNPFNGALQYHGAMLEQLDYDVIEWLGDDIDFESVAAQQTKYLKKNNLPLKPLPTFDEVLTKVLGWDKMEAHLRFLDLIEYLIEECGKKVNIYTGNHNNILELYHGRTEQGITYLKDAVVNIGGIPTLLEHGHRNDKYCDGNFDSTWLVKQCCRAIDGSVVIDRIKSEINNYLRAAFGKEEVDPTYHFTDFVKELGKRFVDDVYEKGRDRALERGAKRLIMGHTHIPGIFDVTNIMGRETLHRGEYSAALSSNPLEIISQARLEEPFYCLNGGDGFTHGSALRYGTESRLQSKQGPDKGFEFIDKTMIGPSEIFDLSKVNPHQKYRKKTLARLEMQYKEAFLPYVDLETGWNHAGPRLNSNYVAAGLSAHMGHNNDIPAVA